MEQCAGALIHLLDTRLQNWIYMTTTRSVRSGVGRGIAPRPQPQTGRASFQASGFPDDSILICPSRF